MPFKMAHFDFEKVFSASKVHFLSYGPYPHDFDPDPSAFIEVRIDSDTGLY